jgi:hypothetical protein
VRIQIEIHASMGDLKEKKQRVIPLFYHLKWVLAEIVPDPP